MKAEDEKRFDIRLNDRNLRDGVLEAADVASHDESLPDLTDQADWLSYDEISSMRVAPLAARERGLDEDESGRDDD